MRDLIRDLSGQGMTVLLSSHLLTEVEELCNRVAIVREGRRRLPGLAGGAATPGRAAATCCGPPTTSVPAGSPRPRPGIGDVQVAPERGLAFSAESEAAIGALSLALAESGALILELSSRHATPRGPLLQPDRGRGGRGTGRAPSAALEGAA